MGKRAKKGSTLVGFEPRSFGRDRSYLNSSDHNGPTRRASRLYGEMKKELIFFHRVILYLSTKHVTTLKKNHLYIFRISYNNKFFGTLKFKDLQNKNRFIMWELNKVFSRNLFCFLRKYERPISFKAIG